MSADYRTEHFKGFQNNGYIHIVRAERNGEYPLGNLTFEELQELNDIFRQSNEDDEGEDDEGYDALDYVDNEDAEDNDNI